MTKSYHSSRMMAPPRDLTPHREEMYDPSYGSDVPAAERLMPLADFECDHGRLHTDRGITCECFGPEFSPSQLLDGIRGLASGPVKGYTRSRNHHQQKPEEEV